MRSPNDKHRRSCNSSLCFCFCRFHWAAETLEQLIAACEEGEELISLPAGNLWREKGLAEIRSRVQQEVRLNSRILLRPVRNESMAARAISEYKVGGKASTGYLSRFVGAIRAFAKEGVLEEANLSAIFPG
jgi:hypothetical protein